jgi:hypothetical protein
MERAPTLVKTKVGTTPILSIIFFRKTLDSFNLGFFNACIVRAESTICRITSKINKKKDIK